MDGISKETYKNLPDSNKLDILLDLHVETKEELKKLAEKLDRRKRIDTTASAFFGFVGGAMAALGQKIFLGKS